MSCRRLFLDLRFWNDFCDVALGDTEKQDVARCLDAVRAAVANGSLVCPIEYYAFAELHKQRLPAKQAATVQLVDELSAKTVMVMPFERVFLEFLRFSQAAATGRLPTLAPAEEMWTRPMYVFGHTLPDLPPSGLPSALDLQLRRQFADDAWNFGFTDMLRLSGPFPASDEVATADLLNQAKADPTTQFPSFEATYRSEVLGSLDAYAEQLDQVSLYLFQRHGGDPATATREQRDKATRHLRDVIYTAYLKYDLTRTLPTLHVGATLYSRLQWDRKRPYKSNDVFDFGHAEAALPYCSAFATDGALATLITQSGMHTAYGCDVLTTAASISDWLLRTSGPPTLI
jgi:hypothetical protein